MRNSSLSKSRRRKAVGRNKLCAVPACTPCSDSMPEQRYRSFRPTNWALMARTTSVELNAREHISSRRPVYTGRLIGTQVMNKAFVREPEDDGRAFCPRCRSLGNAVDAGPLDSHIRSESRAKLGHDAWVLQLSAMRCRVLQPVRDGRDRRRTELARVSQGSRRADLRLLRFYLRRSGGRRGGWHAESRS